MEATVSHKGRVGATVRLPAGAYPNCPGGTLDPCSIAAFDGLIGRKMAVKAYKAYYLPGDPPALPTPAMVAYTQAGGDLLISFRPPKAPTTVDRAAFTTSVANHFTELPRGSWKACIWQEPNTGKSIMTANDTPFTADTYKAYAGLWTPLFRKAAPGVKIVYDPAVCGLKDNCNPQSALDFIPEDFDEGAADYYGTAYARGGYLDDLSTRMHELRKPFGAAEIGAAAGPTTFDLAEFEAYMGYLKELFATRINNGWHNGTIMWWSGIAAGGPGLNGVLTPTDPKIPAIRGLYDAVAAKI